MPPLRAGQLRSRVELQTQVRADDGAGGFTSTWRRLATAWARVVMTGGGEQPEAEQRPSRRTYDVTIRRRPGLASAALRVVRGAQVLSVTSVQDDDTAPDQMILKCLEEPGADPEATAA